MTSPFDTFGSGQNWPSNPTVPPSAPPGYATPPVPNPAQTQPTRTPQQVEALGTALIDGILAQVLLAVANISIGGETLGQAFPQLQQWATQLEQNAQDALNNANNAQTTANDALSNWTTVLESLGLPDQTATAFVSWLQELLSPNSPLNASNLWGLLPSSLVTNVSSTAINSATVNQLWNPNFQTAAALQPGNGWSWDSTVYYTPEVGTAGSATVTADGTPFGLRSNPIPVSGGQSLTLSAQILTSGLVATGTPIQLGVVTYKGGVQVGVVSVVTSAAPSGATASWTGAPSGSVAGSLSGTYSVPNDGTVDSVRVRLGIDSTATAGEVWFGATAADLSGGLIATIQSDLSSLSDDFTAGNNAFSTFLQTVLTDITNYTSWSTFITNVESAWNTYVTTATDLTSAEFFTLQQLIQTLLGYNVTTGQLPGTNVSTVLGQSSLASDVQAILDYIANALGHSGTGHTLTDIETYLGIIPPANVANVLGGANLGADLTAVNGLATNSNTWWGRFMTDLTIYLDLFHVTYPAGSPTDTPTTTIGGVRTWYSAIADFQALFGVIQTTSAPAVAAADVGTAHQALTDAVATGATGTAQTDTTTSDAQMAVGALQSSVSAVSASVQAIQTARGGTNQSGAAYAINFNQYPDGPFPTTDWTVIKSGTGSDTLEISNGNAVVSTTDAGDNQFLARYDSATLTDYQTLNATIAGLPQGAAKTYAVVRANAAMDTYVYAGVYLDGYTLGWELGCFVSGVHTVLESGTGAPLNFSFEFKAGVDGNPNRFQGISGQTLVFDYIDDTGTGGAPIARSGASYRYFGFKSITDNNGQYAPAPGSYIGCFDDSPASTVGSGIRQYNSQSTPLSATLNPGANPLSGVSTTFFDTTTSQATPDLQHTNNSITVTNSGWYKVDIRIMINTANTVSGQWNLSPMVYRNGNPDTVGPTVQLGNYATFQAFPAAFGGSMTVYCNADDVLTPGYYIDTPGGSASVLKFQGDASGLGCYWSIALINRSLA